MAKRRKLSTLLDAVESARSRSDRAIAHYNLGLFHDNNGREAEAIPHYEAPLELGLDGAAQSQALAWLASSLYKTGGPGGSHQTSATVAILGLRREFSAVSVGS